MTTWLFATCAALAVIPTTYRDRAMPARPVRGGETSLKDVRVDAEEVDAAKKAFAGRIRIAVVPFTAPAGDAELGALARGCTLAVTADLRYATGLLVLDPSELPSEADPAARVKAARKIGVRYLLTGAVERKNGGPVWKAELTDLSNTKEDSPSPIAEVSDGGNNRDVHALAAWFATELFLKPNKPGPFGTKEIAKVPTTSAEARTQCDAAVEILSRSTSVTDDQATRQALSLVEAARKADPNYLRAVLVEASCQARLGQKKPFRECLKAARQVRDSEATTDALTLLELKGDYELFVNHDQAKAVETYSKILAIDPTHPNALWMLTAVHAGEFTPPSWPGLDLKKAGEYAARLIAAHPDTAAAKFLESVAGK